MQDHTKLIFIKSIHTLIWIFFAALIFYIFYSGLTGDINYLTWIAIGFVILEGLVLLIFNMFCPLTLIARKFSDSGKDNFDIFLPEWIARNNKLIFSIIFVSGLVLIGVRLLI
ncbi:MAG: hypothetical protein DWQ02_19235 [Bacteroidetes bacterium]|nr:MAG: hypothetical protein DWQ02_19235 [Bacteroidota bacterium]